MNTSDLKGACAALVVSALSVAAFAGASFTWTGAAGNNLYWDQRNWTISGSTNRGGPSWTESGVVDTDSIGHDVTIILNTDDCHPDVFKTKGSYKVTLVADANNYSFRPYWLQLLSKDNVFDVAVSMHSVNNGKRTWDLYSNATFNKSVYLPDNTTINNRSDVNGSCLGVTPNAIHFYDTVTVAAGKALGLRRAPYTTAGTVHFHGPLVCDDLRFGLGWTSGYAYFYSQANQIGKVAWAYSNFVCGDDNVYPSTLDVSWPSSLVNPANNANEFYWSDNSSTYTAFNLNGHSQTAAKVAYEHESRRPWIDSGKPATLTLNGSGTGVANVKVGGKVSLVVDSADLVQDFRDSQSTTEGTLTVKQGTLRCSGATSFVNVKDLVIDAGATFDLSSTTSGALGGLTNITVAAGGTLKVGSGVLSPFGTSLAIRLADGAWIETDSDFAVANGLWVDGTPVPSDTYSSATWLKGTGAVTVNAPNVEATYVWTGLGGDNRVSTAGNWEGGVLPVFTSTLATYVIPVAADGTPVEILVDRPVSCKALHFCSPTPGEVTLAAENNGKLMLVNGEINATNGTYAVIASLDLPVEYEGPLTLRAGSDDKQSNSYSIRFLGSINSIGNADITKYGYGSMLFEGDGNLLQGDIHNHQGCCEVRGTNPIGGGSSYALYNYPNAGDTATILNLVNATVNRNIVTRNPSDQCGPTIRLVGTVTVNGKIGNNAGVAQGGDSGHLRIHVGAGSDTATGVVNGQIVAHNNGFLVVTGNGGSLRCNGLVDCVRVYCDSSALTVLDIGNVARGLAGSDYGWYMKIPLRINMDNCLYREVQGDQYYECRSASAGIDLNGHKVTLANFGCDATSFAAGGGYIKGGAGSKLTLNGDVNDSVGVHILEAASLVRAGTGTTTIADACSSTGTLDVVSGTVAIVSGGSWDSCSRVAIGGGAGTARVTVAAGRGFGKSTVLSIGDNGTLDLAEGVAMRVAELWLNGVRQVRGYWGSPESGTGNKSAFFTGKGTVTVGDPGMVFVIR